MRVSQNLYGGNLCEGSAYDTNPVSCPLTYVEQREIQYDSMSGYLRDCDNFCGSPEDGKCFPRARGQSVRYVCEEGSMYFPLGNLSTGWLLRASTNGSRTLRNAPHEDVIPPVHPNHFGACSASSGVPLCSDIGMLRH
jgi:hypothetical protein